MNEKYLWELWAKCKHPHPKHGGGDMVWPMEFAELIVRECAEVGKQSITRGIGMAISQHALPDYVKEKIQKHFGVEE